MKCAIIPRKTAATVGGDRLRSPSAHLALDLGTLTWPETSVESGESGRESGTSRVGESGGESGTSRVEFRAPVLKSSLRAPNSDASRPISAQFSPKMTNHANSGQFGKSKVAITRSVMATLPGGGIARFELGARDFLTPPLSSLHPHTQRVEEMNQIGRAPV